MQMVTAKPHSNIIGLKHFAVEESNVCFIVMERYSTSLAEQIQEWAGRESGSPWKTKLYSYTD